MKRLDQNYIKRFQNYIGNPETTKDTLEQLYFLLYVELQERDQFDARIKQIQNDPNL